MFSFINKQSLNTWAISMYNFVITFLRSLEFRNFLDTCKMLLEKIYNSLPSINSLTSLFEKNIVENILTPNEISYAKEKFEATEKNISPVLRKLYKKAGSSFFTYVYNDRKRAFSFNSSNETVSSEDVPPIFTPDEISRMKEKFENAKENIKHTSRTLYTQMSSFLSTYIKDTEEVPSSSSVPPLVKKEEETVESVTEPFIIKQSAPSTFPAAMEYPKESFCESFPKYKHVVNDIDFTHRKDPREENMCFVKPLIYHAQQRPENCEKFFHSSHNREQKIPCGSVFTINPALCPDPKLSKLSFKVVKSEKTDSGFAINVLAPTKSSEKESFVSKGR